jgi:hypothetical protein
MIKIQMKDKSVYVIKDKMMERAIKIRQKEAPKFLDKMPAIIAKHWKAKTLPTKFGWDMPWSDAQDLNMERAHKYKDQADMAPMVMYQYVRPIMMGLMMQKLAKMKPEKKGKKTPAPKVIALGKNGNATEYPSGKKVKLPWLK